MALTTAPSIRPLLTSMEAEATWESKPSEGKSLELLTLALVYGALTDMGAAPVIPSPLLDDLDLFLARNEVPRQHGAQAGHSGARRVPSDQFIAAFTPKISFEIAGRSFSLFREGYPIHSLEYYVKNRRLYGDRPDFIIVEGQFSVSSAAGIITVTAELENGRYLAKVRELNRPVPQFVDWVAPASLASGPHAILECSWNKSSAVAARQLLRYRELMPPVEVSQTLFVSAKQLSGNDMPVLVLSPDSSDPSPIIGYLTTFLRQALKLDS